MRLKESATTCVRYGYRRLHILVQREGWNINAKRVYRLYGKEFADGRSRPSVALVVANVPITLRHHLAWVP